MKTSYPEPLPDIRPPLDVAEIHRDAAALCTDPTRLLISRKKFSVFSFIRSEAPALFHELARQREITFRASAQGSGTDWDTTPEDDYYHQLILWDNTASCLAGAYRIGFSARVLSARGMDGLYLSHMFAFEENFFNRLGPAMELSRSFIVPAYQRDPLALALLWQGLGQLATRHPEVRGLFGAVTISAKYSAASRDLLVGWLNRYAAPSQPPLAIPRIPFVPSHVIASSAPIPARIDTMRHDLVDPHGNSLPVPPLIRHYLHLGATFHAFHREPSFGDAIYCLLDVRLDRLSPAQRRHFLVQ